MSKLSKSTIRDIMIYGIIVVACGAIFIETLDLPPGSFEPLGSGFMPRAISALVIFFCCIMIIAALRNPEAEPEAGLEPDRKAGVHLVLATLALAVLFHSRLVDFGILVALFLFVSILALERFDKKKMVPAGITAFVVGFGFKYIFTKFFVVDLPVWF